MALLVQRKGLSSKRIRDVATEVGLSVGRSSVRVMASAPEGTTRGRAPHARPVLDAARESCDALAGAGAGQLWALSDGEVEEAMAALGRLHASSEAHLAAVLVEAQSRGLGVGQGWGAQDWARMRAPG